MINPSKDQLLDLLRPRFGSDVELVCENPVFVGSQSMVSLGVCGMLFVYRDEAGKTFAVQVPIGPFLMTEEAA